MYTTDYARLTTVSSISSEAFQLLETLQNALSASKELRENFESTIFSSSLHPYEKLKKHYIEESDYTPIDIQNFQETVEFCARTSVAKISAISTNYHNNFMSYFAENSASNTFDQNCVFVELSTTNESSNYVINRKKASNYLKFLETIKNIPIDLIQKDPDMLARKIVGYYISATE